MPTRVITNNRPHVNHPTPLPRVNRLDEQCRLAEQLLDRSSSPENQKKAQEFLREQGHHAQAWLSQKIQILESLLRTDTPLIPLVHELSNDPSSKTSERIETALTLIARIWPRHAPLPNSIYETVKESAFLEVETQHRAQFLTALSVFPIPKTDYQEALKPLSDIIHFCDLVSPNGLGALRIVARNPAVVGRLEYSVLVHKSIELLMDPKRLVGEKEALLRALWPIDPAKIRTIQFRKSLEGARASVNTHPGVGSKGLQSQIVWWEKRWHKPPTLTF